MILGQLRIGARTTTYAALVGGLVDGCGARAVSRKTPIYFIYHELMILWTELALMT